MNHRTIPISTPALRLVFLAPAIDKREQKAFGTLLEQENGMPL